MSARKIPKKIAGEALSWASSHLPAPIKAADLIKDDRSELEIQLGAFALNAWSLIHEFGATMMAAYEHAEWCEAFFARFENLALTKMSCAVARWSFACKAS